MNFFTADLHFGDDEIIERESRPFKDILDFEEAFVANVNKMASENDTLYVMGDWINYNKNHHPDFRQTFKICKRLRPSVILIMGNGEERVLENCFNGNFEAMRSELKNLGFKEVYWELDIEVVGEKMHLIHRPINHKKDCINLFGHTHRGTGLWKPFGFNMGIDLNCFRPFSESDLLSLLEKKRLWWDDDPDTNCY